MATSTSTPPRPWNWTAEPRSQLCHTMVSAGPSFAITREFAKFLATDAARTWLGRYVAPGPPLSLVVHDNVHISEDTYEPNAVVIEDTHDDFVTLAERLGVELVSYPLWEGGPTGRVISVPLSMLMAHRGVNNAVDELLGELDLEVEYLEGH